MNRLLKICSWVILVINTISGWTQINEFQKIHGLSQNTVYSIMQDKQGLLWIGTANGLNRFDGTHIKIYKPPFDYVEGKMKGRIIRSNLLEDNHDRIWFSSDIAVQSFNKRTQTFSSYPLQVKRKNGNEVTYSKIEMFANPLLIERDTLWLVDATSGLFALHTGNGACVNYPLPGLPNKTLSIMNRAASLKDGNIWFASQHGLLCFNRQNHQWRHFLKESSFDAITASKDTLYLGNANGITWFQIQNFSNGYVPIDGTPPFTSSGKVETFCTEKNGTVWAGDQYGNIYRKSHHQKKFSWFGGGNLNPSNTTRYPVYCLYNDDKGLLWAGYDIIGLQKAIVRPKQFHLFPDASYYTSTLRDLFVHSIYEENEQKLWIGTFQNGLILLNKTNGTTQSIDFPETDAAETYSKSVSFVKCDAYGNLWTSCSGTLYVREKNKGQFLPIKFPASLPLMLLPQLWNMTKYKRGWIMATNIGLFVVEGGNGKYSIRLAKTFRGTKIIQVLISPHGKLWVVPETGGIHVLNDPDETTPGKIMFANTNVKAIIPDTAHHLIWICSTSGLISLNPDSGKYRVYNEEDGLPSSYLYIAIPIGNHLWLSTNNGISKALLSYTKHDSFPKIVVTTFTKSDGLAENDFNTGAYFLGKSGTLYFGNSAGVTWFKPSEIGHDAKRPIVQIIDLLANDKPADSFISPEYLKNVKLYHTENNLMLRFQGISFMHEDLLQYRYRLKGWDKEWVYSRGINQIRYNNLPAGNYQFEVAAAYNNGEYGPEKQINITIEPPFWQTWWFYSLLIISTLTIIIITIRFFAQQKLRIQIAELEKQKEIAIERQRISREMHDEIGAGLTQITLMSESASKKINGMAASEIEAISDTSRSLVSNLSEIIWSLGTENKTTDHLFAYLREHLDKQLEYSGIKYSIVLPDNEVGVTLSNAHLRNIIMVTKELVNNAVKHSHAANMNIQAQIFNGALQIQIEDDGIGFDTQENFAGNGLRNIRHRITELKGVLEITSVPKGGSRFEISLPLDNYHT